MLPTILTIICPKCQEDMHYGTFENLNVYSGEYASCPFCNEKFDFGSRINDKLEEYDYENNLSKHELILNNARKFIGLYENSQLFIEEIGDKKMNTFRWWLMKTLSKRRVDQKRRLYGKLKEWDKYYFYSDLQTVLENKEIIKKQPVFENKKFNLNTYLS